MLSMTTHALGIFFLCAIQTGAGHENASPASRDCHVCGLVGLCRSKIEEAASDGDIGGSRPLYGHLV
jgi:hypothetical protein